MSDNTERDPGQVVHRDWVQQQGFTQVENVVLRDANLSMGARLLYALLKMHAWQKDSAFPGQERLGELMGVKIRMVQIYLKELIDAGLIERTQRGGTKSNVYHIQPLSAIYCAGDTQSITGHKAQDIAGHDTQSITPEEYSGKNTQKKNTKRKSAPALVDIPTEQTPVTATRDMQSTGRAIKPTPIKQTQLPSDYPLTEEMRVWARMETPDLGNRLDTEHKKFCNHYRSKAERRANWRPVWETWMIRAVEDFAPKQKGSSNGNHYESPAERREREWAAALGSIGPANYYQNEPEPELAALPERTADARIISLNGRRVG